VLQVGRLPAEEPATVGSAIKSPAVQG